MKSFPAAYCNPPAISTTIICFIDHEEDEELKTLEQVFLTGLRIVHKVQYRKHTNAQVYFLNHINLNFGI